MKVEWFGTSSIGFGICALLMICSFGNWITSY